MNGLVLITIGVILSSLASIAVLINTQTILRDLSEIKKKLDIKEKNPSFFDHDLDID